MGDQGAPPVSITYLQYLGLQRRHLVLNPLIDQWSPEQKNLWVGDMLPHLFVSDILGAYDSTDDTGVAL